MFPECGENNFNRQGIKCQAEISGGKDWFYIAFFVIL